MSDLAATNCQNVNNGCDGGFGNCLFPLLLLCCCGNGNVFGGNDGNGCCDIIWLLLILSCCGCGNGFGFGGGNNCCCG